MKMQKRSTLFRALLCSSTLAGITSQVFGQEGAARVGADPVPPAGEGDGVAGLGAMQPSTLPNYDLPQFAFPTDPGPWYTPPAATRGRWQDEIGPRFRFESRIGEWLGSDDSGEGAVNLMLPLAIGDTGALLYLDGRGISTFGGGAAGSLGTGIRYFDSLRDRIWGLSGYWDYDSGNDRDYNQVGVGIESIGRWVDFRANGYIALGNTTNLLSQQLTGVVTPSGTGFLAQARQQVESSYSGLDAEIGGPLPVLGRYGIEAYVGGYYFQSDDDEDISGVSVRIAAHATDDLDLGINVTNDQVFDTSVFGTVVLTLPDGRPQRFFRPESVENKLLDRVQRRYRVMTHQQTRLASIPATGMIPPMGAGGGAGAFVSSVIFVDPNAGTNGVGSFERPFNTFEGFATPGPNSLILVRSGNVTGEAVLPTGSFLFSEAYLNANPLVLTTSLGAVMLPTLNGNATTPVWSNPNGGTLVSITGNNTEIAGFIFDGTTPAGPFNSIIAGQNISGVKIHDNVFRNYGDAAIDLRNVTGTLAANTAAQIYSNQFQGSTGRSFNGFRLINNGIGTLDLEFGQTDANLLTSLGTAVGNTAYGNSGEDANGNGILDAGEDRNGNFTLDTGAAYTVTAQNRAVINARVIGNTAGAEGDANSDGSLNSEDINNNGVLDPGEDTNSNGRLDFGDDLNRNGRFDLGSGTGFIVSAGATQSVVNLTMTDNIADRNVGAGILLTANESTLNAGTLGEDVNGDGRLSGYEDTNRNGILDPGEDLDGDNFLDFGEDANEDLNNNGILDPGEDRNGDGFLNRGNRNNRLDGGQVIARNTVTRNGGDGIRVDAINNSNVSLRVVGNTVGSLDDRSTGNRGIGLNVNSDGGSLIADIGYVNHEDLDLDGVLDPGEDLNQNGRIGGPLAADQNQFVANQGGGLNFNLTGTATGRVNVINNAILGTGGGLLDFSVNGDTTGLPFTFSNGSAPGIDISQITWNVAAAGLEFNTGANRGGTDFTPQNATETTTGLQTLNGVAFPTTLADRSSTLGLTFNDFNPGNGVLDAGEDVNEDVNGNGILDTGEDLNGDLFLNVGNGNGILDAGEDAFENFSFLTDLDPAGAALAQPVLAPQLIGSIIDVRFSTGQQVRGTMQADPVTGGATFVQGLSNLGTGNGLAFNVADSSVLQTSTILGNTITDFGGAGLFAQSTEAGNIQNLIIRNNTIARNGSANGVTGFRSGIELRTQYIPTPPIVPGTPEARLNTTILQNVIANNVGGGVDAFATGGALTVRTLEDNQITGNGRGVSLASAGAAILSARITNNTISDNIASSGTSGDGIEITASSAQVILNEIAANVISANAGDGIEMTARNNGVITVRESEDVNGNNVLDPGEDANEDANNNGVLDPGEDVNLDGFLNRGNGNGLIDRGIFGNTLVSNTGGNLVVNATGGSDVSLGTVNQNVITSLVAGDGGVVIDLASSTFDGVLTANTITGTSTTNVGPGVLLNSSASTFDLRVGGANAADGNIISLRDGAGIAVVMTDTGSGQFVIQNNLITGIRDDGDATTPYEGDGVNVSLVGSTNPGSATATLNRSEISDNVIGSQTNANLGTAGSGISVLASEETTIADLLVARNTIGQSGNDNATGGTTDDAGIEFDRLDNARFNIVNPRPGDIRAVTIVDNNVQNTAAGVDGLFINVMNGIRDDIDFEIRSNIFSGNGGHGIHLFTQADASLATDITSNLIENNLLDGIRLNGRENTAADLETQGGTWTRNIIRGNQNNGITLNSVFGDVIPLVIGQNGVDPLTGESLGNIIANNGHDGIEINAPGSASILNNRIFGNGLTADLPGDDDAGLNITLTGTTGDLALLLQNNTIVNNTGDGIESRITSGTRLVMVALGNTISNNTGRGVDVLNQGFGTTSLRFGDDTLNGRNEITSNGFEGFYVVNTASTNQTQTQANGNLLLADGSVVASSPNMVLDIRRNIISGNNDSPNATFESGGLTLLVGSSNGGLSFTGASDSGLVTASNAVGTNSGNQTLANGRVNARIQNNTFDGNLGHDLLIAPFISTVAPVTTAGTWDATTFAVTAFQGDPLSRLNLVFNGNTGDSNIVNRVAAFTNAEGTFKSRVITATPGGPFLSPTRPRLTTRIPFRGNPTAVAPFTGPDNGIFEFPGIGASSFRIEEGFQNAGFLAQDAFITDQVPPLFPNSTFGWGVVPAGTFSFDQPFIGLIP